MALLAKAEGAHLRGMPTAPCGRHQRRMHGGVIGLSLVDHTKRRKDDTKLAEAGVAQTASDYHQTASRKGTTQVCQT